jgi:hypothetical protein
MCVHVCVDNGRGKGLQSVRAAMAIGSLVGAAGSRKRAGSGEKVLGNVNFFENTPLLSLHYYCARFHSDALFGSLATDFNLGPLYT